MPLTPRRRQRGHGIYWIRPLPLVAAIAALSATLPGAPASFDPEEHFPKESLYYISIDAGLLRTGFKETPFGRILMHPGVEKAFAGARARLLERLLGDTQDFQQATGLDLLQFLDLFTGKVALTIPAIDMAAGPRMLISADLGTKRKEMEKLLETLGAAYIASAGGGEATTTDVKEVRVTTWPARFGPSFQHAIIGDAVVFSVGDTLEPVITRYQAREASQDSLRFNETYARVKVKAPLSSPVATVFVDYGKFYGFLQQIMGFAPDGEKVLKVMTALGFDKLSSVLWRAGIRDGDFEAKLFLESPGGLSGFIGTLAECLGPGEDETALSRVPAGSLEIGSQSIALGRLARAIVDLASGIPEAAPAMDSFVSKLEEVTGLSMEGDIYSLPRLSIYSFNALPPGGGFVPDQCAIVRKSQFQPYLVALDKFARKAGAAVKRVSIEGRDVAYLSAGQVLSRLGLAPGAGDPPPPVPDAADPAHTHHPVVLKAGIPMDPSLTLAFAPIDSDWMVVASTPQAVGRYFSSYSKAPSVTADETTAALIRKEMGKDASFTILRGGRHLVHAWNTALALAMMVAPVMEKKLEEIGIDPAHLPPGEELAPAFRDGFLLTRRTADGCLVHGHRVLSNLMGSPTIASSLLAMGLQANASKSAAAGGGKPLAEERLQKLGQALRRHAETAGNGAYPRDDDQGLPSLQVLVDEGLVAPGDLVHPRGERAASPDASGKVTLDREHVSYELVSWKQGPTDSPGRLLAYEKKAYEGNGRRALFVDTSVRLLEESEFQKLLEEQRSRYGKAQPEKEGE